MRSLSGRPDGPDQFRQQGWPGQLARVERWHRRTADLLVPARRVPEAEIVDFLYAFFQAAYHMRDWLLKSGGASEGEVKALFADNRCLGFCRDVCNGSKHFELAEHHDTARIGLMREYVPPRPGDDSDGGSSRPSLLSFQDRDGYVDFVAIDELLRDCLTTWQAFCSAR
jgi:hypothetical protein